MESFFNSFLCIFVSLGIFSVIKEWIPVRYRNKILLQIKKKLGFRRGLEFYQTFRRAGDKYRLKMLSGDFSQKEFVKMLMIMGSTRSCLTAPHLKILEKMINTRCCISEIEIIDILQSHDLFSINERKELKDLLTNSRIEKPEMQISLV